MSIEQNSPKKIYLETLGCSKNRVDSEIMMASLKSSGFQLTMRPESADVIVVNTCAFLTAATEESINRILELSDYKSIGNCEKLVATGCLSQRYGQDLMGNIPELDGLLGSNNFDKIPQLVRQMYENTENPQIFLNQKPHYSQYPNQNRILSTPSHFAYIKVAEGCSNMCSFCNIPFLRGGFSSRSIDSIKDEIRELTEQGVKEINIISQDTSSYGLDFKNGTNLEDLISGISLIPGDFWIRLFYCYPNTFSEKALKMMSDDHRFCHYLDMPFQHVDDQILKDMNRKITEKQIRTKIDQIRHYLPDAAIRTTFIVGFPTETDQHFEKLLGFVKEGHFTHIGVFPYSHEDNIRSAKWGDPVSNVTKKQRKDLLMKAQQELSLTKNSDYVGKQLKVLVDGVSEESELLLQGRSQFQGPEVDGIVYINDGEAVPGSFHMVEITDAHPYDLVGHIVA
ncbi:MAG: 30S ribosomal protein S12 methylthiotransferase RimO [SAR324 cluster bacterium]|nr:30S ribosomal protein S12 methylthiotransferase RimO [SAR324 cluster bacterium]